MRTRSQPASPGGFVSLETEPTTSRRVTRSTRSASRTVSQESSSQQATEPSTQAAPLPKSQRKIKKPVSRKTAATTTSTAPSDTTSSTATTTKTQTRKAPKRGSRKTTRKAQKATSDETESNAETIIESTGENEDGAANGVEISKSDKSDKALLEPDSSYRKNPSSCYVPLPSVLVSSSPLSSPLSLPSPPLSSPLSLPSPPLSPSLSHTEDSDLEFDQDIQDGAIANWVSFLACQEIDVPFNPQPLEALDDSLLNLLDVGDSICPAWYELNPDELASLEYAVSEHANSPDPLHPSWLIDLQLDDKALLQIAESQANHDATVDVPSTFVQVNLTEPTTAESESAKPTEHEQSTDITVVCEKPIEQQKTVSPLASAVDSDNKQTAMEDTSFTKTLNLLSESFTRLSLSDVSHRSSKEVAVSSESTPTPVRLPKTKPASETTTSTVKLPISQPPLVLGASVVAAAAAAAAAAAPLPSIFDLPEPSIPSLSLFAPPKRVPYTLFSSIPDSPSSIYDDGQSAQQQLAPVVSVEAPDLIPGPQFRQARAPPRKPRVSPRQLRSARLTRHQRRRLMHLTPALLSPILEQGEVDPGACTSLGHHESPDRRTTPASPSPVVSATSPALNASFSSSPPPAPSSHPASSALSSQPSGTSVEAVPRSVSPDLSLSSPPTCLETTTKRRTTTRPQDTQTKEIHPKATRTSARIRDKQTKDPRTATNDSRMSSLTSKKVNRKRAHSQASPEDDAEPSTLSANKRRNLGTPRSTPFRRTTLSRRLPNIPVSYSERQLRRRTESQGRITRTIFRLPQLVAQNEADRLAAESSAPASPSPGPLQVIPEFSVEQALNNDQITPEKPAAAQEPSTPESTNSRWNIRGLLNSVPRSFSRFLPSFARTPAQAEALVPQQPSSERVQRTRATEAVSTDSTERELQPRRRLSEQLSAQRTRNLSYSLFPPPIDRSLYLGDIPKATAKTSSSALETTPVNQSEHEVLDAPEPQESATPILHERSRDRTPHVTPTAKESQKEKKKRKRSPSPDVIPNPVGSSYGMDLDYFCYSSESEDEDTDTSVPQTEPKKPDTLAKTALRSSVQSERPASKKVRFDASPEDTPSRRRARATDPYTGIHFIGMGNPQPSTTPTTPTPQQPIADPTQQPGFIPNRSGTFQLDYDAFSDDSDSSGAPSPPSTPAPASVIQTPTFMQPTTPENAQPSTPRTTARAVQPMPTPAKVDEEALARARSQAEKYKPKTPSGLRTASRYSSPLTAPTPDATPAPAVEKIAEQFGDDQFAQDAQWLYEHCPSGDLSQLVWPQPTSLAETLGISDEAVRIMSEVWDESQVDEYYPIFQQGVEELKQTLAL